MRRRAFLSSCVTAGFAALSGCQEPEFGTDHPSTAHDYGTVRCGLSGDRTTEPASESAIDSVDGTWPTTYFDERRTAYNPNASPPRDCPQVQWGSQVEVQARARTRGCTASPDHPPSPTGGVT